MADYNVNMKQWNGTSFDNVLPLAYNAKQLGGTTLSELKTWVQDNNLLLFTGQYVGTGVIPNPDAGGSAIQITFPFEPILFFAPNARVDATSGPSLNIPILTSVLNSQTAVNIPIPAFTTSQYFRISEDRKTIYITATSGNYDSRYLNSINDIYYFAAIGGYDMGGKIPVGATFTITSNESWRVPATGRWMLELYGMGGRGYDDTLDGAQGGASCQLYESITLNKGDTQQIVIGNNSNSATKFGTYSVNNAGNGAVNQGGVGTGNRGKNGIWSTTSGATGKVYGTGELSSTYGWGGGQYDTSGGPGAVYLKYLGE